MVESFEFLMLARGSVLRFGNALIATVVCLTTSVAMAGDLENSLAQSDGYNQHKAAFVTAATKLISNGTCKIGDFEEVGGFVKSVNHKTKPIYFTYCGGLTIPNRIYLNVKTGQFGKTVD